MTGVEIQASWRNTIESTLCTTLANGKGVSVATVEHLMAAFAGLEIDNAVVELDGPEVPVMDGSAAPFVFLIECAGLVEQDAPRRAIRVLKPVSVGDARQIGGADARRQFLGELRHRFRHPAPSPGRSCRSPPDPESFKHDLSPARTFGFLHEVDAMRARRAWRAAARSTTRWSSAATGC